MITRSAIGGAFATALAVSLGGSAVAEATSLTPEPEFPRETRALVDATVALFVTAEAKTGAAEGGSNSSRIVPAPTPAGLEAEGALFGAFPEAYGPVRHLTGYRITWYPVDRLVGAVDFMGTWQRNRNLICGYVTWNLNDPETPELESVITNYVDLSVLDGASPDEVEAVLLEANCAFAQIEANYGVFQ